MAATELEQLKTQLSEREAQLQRELQANRQRAASETFERIAGEAPDPGDVAVADNATDAMRAARERGYEKLLEVQAALERIEAGTYGICMHCGEPIDARRLKAFPTARYDVEHEDEQERKRGLVRASRP
jgi:RNA polymerase-binding protein DksA